MRHSIFALWGATLISVVLSTLLSPQAQAWVRRSKPISRGLEIYVTQRGQVNFDSHLLEIFSRRGYELGEGGFEVIPYKADEPIRLDSLPVQMQPYASNLGQLRDLVKKYFTQADFGDPLINAQIRDIYYSARPPRSTLEFDREYTRSLPEGSGVGLILKIEIPGIHIEAGSSRAWDLSNSFLGQFGVDRAFTDMRTELPFTATIPLSLRLNPKGGVIFELRSFDSNLTSTRWDFGFKNPDGSAYGFTPAEPDPFALPYLGIKVNGRAYPLKKSTVEKELFALHPGLIQTTQAYLSTYMRENLPPKLNALIAKNFSSTLFSDINEMTPPGLEGEVRPQDRYIWGITPQEIRLLPNFLKFGFSAFVEDPRAKNASAEVSKTRVTLPPDLGFINPTKFDVAIAINEDLVNRVIGLSFARGQHSNQYDSVRKLAVPGKEPLEILEAPEFRFEFAGDRGKLHLKVRHRVSDRKEKLAIKNQVTFHLDVNARLIHTADGQLSVLADSIDVGSLSVYTATVRRLFRGIVFRQLRRTLIEANQELAKNPKTIVDALPIPNQVGGIPIKIKDFRADPNGYLVLYTDLDFSR